MICLDKIEKCISEFDKRIEWEEYFMGIALLISSRSTCNRLHVGCVIVNRNNNIVSVGYNGFLAKAPHKSRIRDGHELGTVHAEQNAISYSAKYGVKVDNCKIYLTHYPCINCCKILIASGISEIIYLNDYNNDPIVAELIKENQIKIKKLN